MDARSYAEHVRADGAAMVAAATPDNLTKRVASCPDWTLGDLFRHTGEVHRFWGQVVARRLQAPEESEPVAEPPDDEVVAWLGKGAAELADILEHADPAAAVWTWSTQHDVAFVQRRMAQETAVHRWDAQAAAGAPQPIDPALAVDGIDEFLDVFLGHPEMKPRFADGEESVHLHSTDAPGEWVIDVAGGALTVRREHGKGDAAVRAPASDLLLLLWRRIPPSGLEVFGDAAALERFVGRTKVE
jgi:uncharacterized protein (TIGR03083 family)